ncbi:MAG TPA: phosphoenolpyruvate--protein phosphotransferase [Anaerovoracaceae bacterium]|nr:phosphoenolpyruvate--protein phosphotransferase [Anaerovoracaceae bacterium]
MEKYFGKPANGGIAIGRIKIYRKNTQLIKPEYIDDVEPEKQRFEKAKSEAKIQLQELYQKAVKKVGKDGAAIIEVQEMMLEDLDYTDFVYKMIETQKVKAEYAVAAADDHFSSIFLTMEDDYMKERASDIKDISGKLIAILTRSDRGGSNFELKESAIILADDLTPSETILLDKEKVLAFVTVHGSTNSHTAILARMMDLPALVSTNVELMDSFENKEAIVNGNTGELFIEPDEEIRVDLYKAKFEEGQKKELLQEFRRKESITLDGKKINIFANIGNVSDLASVVKNGADGIGLFRSEFLYLGRNTYPTEEEQFQVYKQAAEAMNGKKVVIRTLDIGADKQVSYFNLDKEENPAMGYRAIRICLDRPEIFKTQLRALYRASEFGNIAIMYPMIISVSEVKQIKKIVEEVKLELLKSNIKFDEVEQGIMIETPAAVMESDALAKEVDFFSIGTNDLTQYTLAIDRQNVKLDSIYDPHHPAVLKMIQMVIENGHKENCWVGICGELGADTTLTKKFLEMGVDELSVAPSFVLPVRKIVCETNLSKFPQRSSELPETGQKK